MGRKLDLMGRKVTEVLEKMDIGEHVDVQLSPDGAAREQLIFTAPADWSPDQAEQYIDWRIQQVDGQVAKMRQQLEDLTALRRRWLAVTGGRSKVLGNGSGNGSSNGSANGNGNGNGNGNSHEVEVH